MVTHLEKGQALFDLDRYEGALAELNLARAENPQDEEPVSLGAFCHYFLGQPKLGLKMGQEALALDPESIRALHVVGLCYTHLGKEKQAKQVLDQAISIDPEEPFGHYYMSWFLGNTGKWKLALTSIERALELDPENATFESHRSKILLKLGRRAEAKSSSLHSLNLDSCAPNALSQLGTVLRQEGDVVGSMKAFRDALRIDPNDEEARKGLLEAIRSRFFLYRWLLNFELQMQRITPQFRSGFTILPLLSLRAMGAISKSQFDPLMKIFLMTICGIYLLFLFSLWFGPIILDALSAVDPELSQVLTRAQRTWSMSLLWTFIIGFCSIVLGAGFNFDVFLILGVVLVLFFVILGAWYRQNAW